MLNWRVVLACGVLVASAASAQDLPAARPGDVVIAPVFEVAGSFYGRFAPVQFEGRWGFLDAEQGLSEHLFFEGVIGGGDDRFGFLEGGKWGYLDGNGNVVIPPSFDEAGRFSNGRAEVRVGDTLALIDPLGWQRTPDRFWTGDATPTSFRRFGGWDGDLIVAEDDEGWAVFDLANDDLYGRRSSLDPWESERGQTTEAWGMSEGTVITHDAGGVNLVLLSDTRELLHGLHEIGAVSDGWAAIAPEPGVWGYYHVASGATVWLGRFEGARDFASGYAPVRFGGKWGYIDTRGEIVWPPDFDDAYPFRDGYAVVRQGDLRGFLRVGADGIEMFIEPRFEDASRFSGTLAPVRIDGAWGYAWNGEDPLGAEGGYAAPEGEIVTISPP